MHIKLDDIKYSVKIRKNGGWKKKDQMPQIEKCQVSKPYILICTDCLKSDLNISTKR